MSITRLVHTLLIVTGILAQGGCERSKPVISPATVVADKTAAPGANGQPSAEDARVAREAITIADVLGMLRADVPNDQIIAEVKRRRMPQVLVEAGELELAANGAGHRLIAALKDPENTLTESEDKAYTIVLTERLKASKGLVKSR